METPSRVATVAAAAAWAALGLAFLGPALVQIGLVSPFVGFRVFGLGLLAGVIAVLLGAVGLWLTRPAAGRAGRGKAAQGLGVGALTLVLILAPALSASGLPAINDITTDTEDPPVFRNAGRLEPNSGRDLSYPGAGFASQQVAAYPDLVPIALPLSADQAFGEARRMATELGWEITAEDTETGTIEAIDVSRVFRFVDDVVIRIRPAAGGCVVDVRSKSRVGRADLGANAARIRTFRDAIRG
jgi:uncharacterized protein (DUF1499 family)